MTRSGSPAPQRLWATRWSSMSQLRPQNLKKAPALQALDALLGAALLAPTDVPRRYRFRHPLVRRAVYDTTADGWRLGAHARAARALEDHGGPLVARAHHLERCAQPGDDGRN